MKKDVDSKTVKSPKHDNFCVDGYYGSEDLVAIMNVVERARCSHVIHHGEVAYGCIVAREVIGYLRDITLANLKISQCEKHGLSQNYHDIIMACKKASNTLFGPQMDLCDTIKEYKKGGKK